MSGHAHVWKPVAHMDGCHWFGWRYACDCGATKETSQERDVSYDPWSAVWMDNEDRDPPCRRCDELMAGAELLPPLEITKP